MRMSAAACGQKRVRCTAAALRAAAWLLRVGVVVVAVAVGLDVVAGDGA